MHRRTLLGTVGSTVASVGLAGCAGGLPWDSESTTTESGVREPTTVDGSNRSRHDVERASADHLLVLANRDDDPHRVTYSTTERSTGLDVYTERRTIEPGFDEAVYTLEDAEPRGIQSYECTLELEDGSASTVLWTNQCYGDATLAVTADGDLTASVDTC
ncbi:hypothetical protein G9C85_01430 [Halorubellus sp. JP-L1]|uniref:hypothetical protein n=1 Tax=Halorubellus sp. JP-L1 TaxID=2715753 RepID=UPI001409AE63|nr:hypothetical protein [Halorubellus sp. JP-L1]NHN40297.1 hypothetical protein [Halorubellus sp. JP-L1]